LKIKKTTANAVARAGHGPTVPPRSRSYERTHFSQTIALRYRAALLAFFGFPPPAPQWSLLHCLNEILNQIAKLVN